MLSAHGELQGGLIGGAPPLLLSMKKSSPFLSNFFMESSCRHSRNKSIEKTHGGHIPFSRTFSCDFIGFYKKKTAKMLFGVVVDEDRRAIDAHMASYRALLWGRHERVFLPARTNENSAHEIIVLSVPMHVD